MVNEVVLIYSSYYGRALQLHSGLKSPHGPMRMSECCNFILTEKLNRREKQLTPEGRHRSQIDMLPTQFRRKHSTTQLSGA